MSSKSKAQVEAEFIARIQEMAEEVRREVGRPLTLTEIEDYALAMRAKMGQAITEALATETREEQVVEQRCEQCGQVMQSKGKKRRKLVTRSGETSLERAYYYCRRCRGGFFPPRPTLGHADPE